MAVYEHQIPGSIEPSVPDAKMPALQAVADRSKALPSTSRANEVLCSNEAGMKRILDQDVDISAILFEIYTNGKQ